MQPFYLDAFEAALFLCIALSLIWSSIPKGARFRVEMRWMAVGFLALSAAEIGDVSWPELFQTQETLLSALALACIFYGIARLISRLRKNIGTAEVLQAALDTSSDGVWLYDKDERVIFTNDRYHEINPDAPSKNEITSFTMEGLLRRNQAKKDPKAAHDPEGRIQTILAERRSGKEIVKEVTRPDGATYLIRAKPTKDGGLLVLQTDITALKSAERELREAKETVDEINRDLERSVQERTHELRNALVRAEMANRSKTDFLANMSHELRTPLNAIIGFADIIRNAVFGPLGSERYKEYADDIHNSGTHLLKLIHDILDIARVEAGQLTIEPEELNIEDVFDNCIVMIAPWADTEELTLVVEVASDTPRVFADELRLKQILLNLAGNAIKYTPKGGTVTLAALSAADGGVTLRISDTGVGMTAKQVETALERFGQVRNDHMISNEGVGLGLAICKSFVELHGGRIDVTSVPGKGTDVTVTLPPKLDAPALAVDQ